MFSHSDIQRHAKDLDLCRNLNTQINWLLGLILVTLSLGIITYGEKFLFWEHALSYLGGVHTQNGSPNSLSLMIFGSGMISCALICLHINRLLCNDPSKYLFRTCGGGFVLMIVPCDLLNQVHSIGAAMVFATLWFFTVLLVNDLNKIYRTRAYLYHFILHGTVLPYAFMYVAGSPFRQAAQKVAVLGMMLILKIATLEHLRASQSLSGQFDEN